MESDFSYKIKSKKFKFKKNWYYHPNYELLKHITPRKDAVAVRAWNFLLNLFITGKEGLWDFQTSRAKRWRTRAFKAGIIYRNSFNGSWILTPKGLEIVNKWANSEITLK